MKVYTIGILLGYIITISKCNIFEAVINIVSHSVSKRDSSPIFLLMHNRESNSPIRLDLPVKDVSPLHGKISREKQLVFIIHGFLSDSNAKWTKRLTKAYLEQRDVTVFVVDWGKVSNTRITQYFHIAAKVPKVAGEIMTFIERLINEFKISTKNIHIIGHSLGAHIAGNIGRGLPLIFRITGLDPAGPMFYSESSPALRETDAEFVDVLHTNYIFGNDRLLGSVDFFINPDSKVQPVCEETVTPIDNYYIHSMQVELCSHVIVTDYFIESIANPSCLFVGTRTLNPENTVTLKKFQSEHYSELGLNTFKYKARGRLYLITNHRAPFCRMNPYFENFSI